MNTSLKFTPARKLGLMIREARDARSQEQLAELVGTVQPVISRYERGTVPSSGHLAALIFHLGLDAEEVYELVHRHYEDQRRAKAAA